MGNPACATVVPDYTLVPTVIVNQPFAQEGDTVQFTYRIQNTGGSSSPSAICVAQATADLGSVPLSCSSGQVFGPSGSPTVVGTENVVVGNQAAGTTICRHLRITPSSSSVASLTSADACVTVGKTPYVRFVGNDVWAGGGFPAITPACNTSGKITTVGRNLTSPPPPGTYIGQYYNNQTLTGSPTLTRSDSDVNFNWGAGSPDPSIPVDHFSVRWTRTQVFEAGSYNFTSSTDDGVRIYVDGVLILDHWIDQGNTVWSANRVLTAGSHTVVMEYYENGGGANATLTIVNTTPPVVETAGSSVEYQAFALNRITGFGSAGKALVGSGTLGSLARGLTFANNEADTTLLGYYGAAQHCLQDYSSLYDSLPVGGALPITSGTSGACIRFHSQV